MFPHEDQLTLEERLDSFDPDVRRRSLETLAARVNSGDIRLPNPKPEVNLHYHTFFSFNANNWSPSRIAWEALKYGLEVAGIVDFDVLDGMEEFLSAGELLGLKTVVGMESRVFIRELADKVMSSPDEPGIAYFMAAGCYRYPPEASHAEAIFRRMAETARTRNISLMERVNAYLAPVQLDYEEDVLTLTPAGNATERHLLTAYDRKARTIFQGDETKIKEFWAKKLGIPENEIGLVLPDTPRFHETMRSKLMKFGGVGYVPPDSGSFPTIEEAVDMIRAMGALPMIAWLDGTNPGEEDTVAFLELLRSKGVVAINIIPERNWNIKDSDEKALKIRKLTEVVEAGRRFHMPISVGTEMNKAGLPFVDDFTATDLRPYIDDFLHGARCIYGHTVLARYANLGYLSEWSSAIFGSDAAQRNAFYSEVGKYPPSPEIRQNLLEMQGEATPETIINILSTTIA